MTRAKRNKAPSRPNHEKNHPTFSFRMYEKLSDRIEAVRKAEGVRSTNIVEAAVGLFEVKVRGEQKIRGEPYQAGGRTADAKEKYSVSYPCSACGKPVSMRICS